MSLIRIKLGTGEILIRFVQKCPKCRRIFVVTIFLEEIDVSSGKWKMAAILDLSNKVLSFCYVFNVFKILSVTTKHLGFENSKWRIKYGGLNVQKFKKIELEKILFRNFKITAIFRLFQFWIYRRLFIF